MFNYLYGEFNLIFVPEIRDGLINFANNIIILMAALREYKRLETTRKFIKTCTLYNNLRLRYA